MIGVLAALAVALLWPAQGFVVGFLVLGPLHYLTEISWLWDRQAFQVDRRGPWLLVGLAAVGTAAALAPPSVGSQSIAVGVMVAAVAVAAWGLGRPRGGGIVAIVAGGLGVGAMRTAVAEPVFVAFGVLLPTLVHVLAFTLVFMLHGVRTRKRREDLLALGTFLAGLVVVSTVALAPAAPSPAFTEIIGFLHARLVRLGLPADAAIRTLAFVYLHHFVNWFQKTERIGWLRMPPARRAVVVAVWLGLVAVAAVDVPLALALGLLPNLAHVLLELPLNARTLPALWAPRVA